ncbi:MAG: ATPase, T2SS/T4P/T4SS family [Halanaerobium sp.]|nr:ATPase, T2SS/T4P/T4SS family [Halanaerobium sp.]
MKKRLGDLLLEYGLISEEQFEEAMRLQKESDKKLGELLVELGYLTETELVQVLEFQLGVPHVDLDKFYLDLKLKQYVPENMARRYELVPLEKKENVLRVAMSDPTNILALDDIERYSGLTVEPVIASSRQIHRALDHLYSLKEEDTDELFESLSAAQEQMVEDDQVHIDRDRINEAPIVRLANTIISKAISQRASDIHIEPQADGARVRYRVDGILKESIEVPAHSVFPLISRLKIMANLDIAVTRRPQDGRIAIKTKGWDLDFRVSTLPTIHGEKVVIRLLNKEEALLQVEELGFSETNLGKFHEMILKPHGIILVSGPTGSGKSTTLAAALAELNSVDKNITTVEDPVEIRISGVNQVQCNNRAGMTFATALRHILRQDPDIIMVGEIRDEETASIAIRAALTGHLVFSTVHTNDAASSTTRLVDMGVKPYLVASSLQGVVAQRLVRRICPFCKEEVKPTEEEMKFLGQEATTIYRGKGCAKCDYTGYRGRMAIQEVMLVNDELRSLISKNRSSEDIKHFAVGQGMVTLKQDGISKIRQGLTTAEEVKGITG